jgi:hypothetical protein
MSLDFVLLKPKHLSTDIADFEADENFAAKEYRELAGKIFPGIILSETDSTIVEVEGVYVDTRASDVSLSLWCRGSGDIFGLMQRIAAQVSELGVIVVDVQTSELLEPTEPSYLAWYRAVLDSTQ